MIVFLRVLATVLLVGITWVASAEEVASTEDTRLVHDMLRTTIVVSDYDRAYELFHDILGMPADFSMDLNGETVNELLGQTGRSMRITIFNVNGTTSGRVAILAYLDDLEAEAPEPEKLDAGAVVVVFETVNIDEISQRVRAAGYRVLAGPSVLFPQANLKVQPREMMFLGPDGIAVNLIQRGLPMDDIE